MWTARVRQVKIQIWAFIALCLFTILNVVVVIPAYVGKPVAGSELSSEIIAAVFTLLAGVAVVVGRSAKLKTRQAYTTLEKFLECNFNNTTLAWTVVDFVFTALTFVSGITLLAAVGTVFIAGRVIFISVRIRSVVRYTLVFNLIYLKQRGDKFMFGIRYRHLFTAVGACLVGIALALCYFVPALRKTGLPCCVCALLGMLPLMVFVIITDAKATKKDLDAVKREALERPLIRQAIKTVNKKQAEEFDAQVKEEFKKLQKATEVVPSRAPQKSEIVGITPSRAPQA